MEIVCTHCNTSHYLSDDKIPLATKIGKCKHCHADIIVLGKNDSSSPATHSIPPEQQASKRCDFCGEKILAIAKKCKYCNSLLNGSASASQNVLEKAIKPATEHTVLPTQIKETAPPHTKKTPVFLIMGSLLAIGGLITAKRLVAKAIGNVQQINQVALHWQMLGFYIPLLSKAGQ